MSTGSNNVQEHDSCISDTDDEQYNNTGSSNVQEHGSCIIISDTDDEQ
jgi:hypothetical protein